MSSLKYFLKKIALEQGHKLIELMDFDFGEKRKYDLFITTDNSFDYFVFLEVDFEDLDFINDYTQIKIATNVRNHLRKSNSEFEVNNYFEKNTYLIISTLAPVEIENKDLYKIISVIEENAYFFKKQVFYYNELEISSFINQDFQQSVSNYCCNLVSNIERYNMFLKDDDLEYGFVSRLFEKIPFLCFNAEEKKFLDLDEIILRRLTDNESKTLTELLKLTNDTLIDEWVNSIGESND